MSGLGAAQVTILEVAGPAQIAQALARDAYHVLHLSAHGSPTGVELEDEDGNAVAVSAADLVQALRSGERRLPLLVLSSCAGAAGGDAGLAATLVRFGADRVLAMQAPVSDRYATDLVRLLYENLAERNVPVAAALAHARTTLYGQAARQDGRRPEYAVATLFAAAADAPLCDPAATPVGLRRRVQTPSGTGVRELALGELIGRRAQLRKTLGVLRGEAATVDRSGAACGVALLGIGGIGKPNPGI